MRAMRFALAGLLALALAHPAGTATTTTETVLKYGGYYAGMRVGEAEIRLRLGSQGYEIDGEAWSVGLMRLATQWESDFDASGRVVDGEVEPDCYRYHYRRRGGHERTTRITEGEWKRFDADGLRGSGPVPEGPDMLSALFHPRDCRALESLHTGRHRYTLELLEQELPPPGAEADYVERCRFKVEDDEGEIYEVELQLGDLDGHRVPLRIEFGGFLSGHVRLLEAPDALFERRPMARPILRDPPHASR